MTQILPTGKIIDLYIKAYAEEILKFKVYSLFIISEFLLDQKRHDCLEQLLWCLSIY